jgi:HPt (histidine-containing phosphotransfer) domain-containing protein
LRRIPYDLVPMDCQMPQLDGYAAAARIRDPRSGIGRRAIPIVALTAHAMKGDRERCLAAGMNDYIAKPVSPEALASVLKKWLPREPKCVHGSSPAVFDESALVARVMGDRKIAGKIVSVFLGDMPTQLALLASNVAAGNSGEVKRLAHRIKGAAASVSVDGLRQVAAEMEAAGQAGDLTAMSAKLPELETQFEAVSTAIGRTGLLASLQSAGKATTR